MKLGAGLLVAVECEHQEADHRVFHIPPPGDKRLYGTYDGGKPRDSCARGDVLFHVEDGVADRTWHSASHGIPGDATGRELWSHRAAGDGFPEGGHGFRVAVGQSRIL